MLENLFVSLNREISKKCALYLPSIKHSPESSSYGTQSRRSYSSSNNTHSLFILFFLLFQALKSHPHEAGYDAFMCGSSIICFVCFYFLFQLSNARNYILYIFSQVFIKLAHALTTYDSKNFYNVRPSNINDYFLMMKPYEGKVHLLKASVDYIVSVFCLSFF